ncbi:MAG: YfhO family protein [Patescibacteria group bacterium]
MLRMFINHRERIYRYFPVLFIFFTVIIYYWPQVTMQAIPYSGDPAGTDLLQVHFPYLAYSSEKLKDLSLPLWTSRVGGGYPLFANGASSFFYPLTQIPFLFLPPLKAFVALFPLHALIAAMGMYWYCRTIGIKSWGATLAGITFAFSGYFVGHLKHVIYFMSASLTPLAFVCVSRFRITHSLKYALMLGVTLTSMLFAGSSQVVYQSILFLVLTTILYCIGTYYQRAITSPSWKERLTQGLSLIKTWGTFALLTALTFVTLSAVQVLPTWELAHHSTRELASSYSFATTFPFHPKNLLTFIEPFEFGNPAYLTYTENWNELTDRVGLFWENIGYLGLIPLLLSIVALPFMVRKRAWYYLVWLCALLFAIALVLGKYSPLYAWSFKWIPGFSSFRVPGRHLLWVDFSLAILAGYAFQQLVDLLLRARKIIFPKTVITLLGITLLGIAFFDLMVFGYHYNAMNKLKIKTWESAPHAATYLNQHNEYRFTTFFTGQYYQQLISLRGGWQNDLRWLTLVRELLPPDYSLFYRIESLPDYSPLPLGRSNSYYSITHTNMFDSVIAKGSPPSFDAYHLKDDTIKLLGLANVKYILSPVPLNSLLMNEAARMTINDASASVYLYELTIAQPKVYLTTNAVTVSSKDEAAATLMQSDYQAANAIVEYTTLPSLNAVQSHAAITSSEEGSYTVRTSTDGSALLVLNESWYPGWRATIDGNDTQIIPVNLAFQGIVVPKGEHTVRFQFQSKTFFWGAMISGIGWLMIILLTIQLLHRRWLTAHANVKSKIQNPE